MLVPAHGKDIQIDPPKCATKYGTAYIDRNNSAAWIRFESAGPGKFVGAMAEVAGCFDIVKRLADADFTLKMGPLSKEQFNQGEAGTLATSPITSPKEAGRGDMRHAYIEIIHNASGTIAGRAFGRNHRADVDFTNWDMPNIVSSRINLALNTKNARLATGAVVNAFFDFTLNPGKFQMAGHAAQNDVHATPTTATPSIARTPAVSAARGTTAAPVTTSKTVLRPAQPAAWARNSTLVFDASTAPSLDVSLQSLLKPLAPRDQLQVMKELFAYVEVARCLDVQTGPGAKNPVSERRCFARFGPDYNEEKAQMYIADRRMDSKTPYATTSLLGGTRKHGRTRTESFIHFIKLYGPYLDGLSVKDYSAKVESYRVAANIAHTNMSNEKVRHLKSNVAQWQKNMAVMPSYAGSPAILKQSRAECQSWIEVTNEEIAAIEAGREFTAPRSRTPNRGRHPCIMIQGRSTMEVLDPDLRRRMKNAKSPEEIMRLTMEASGVTPEQLDGK